jgi:hypothetical protein
MMRRDGIRLGGSLIAATIDAATKRRSSSQRYFGAR